MQFIDMALALHQESLARHGGMAGIRDRGGLESALAQPQAAFGGTEFHPTIYDKAAAYLYHLAKNHPFLDGNKRVAAATALVFLAMNGYSLPPEADEGPLYDLTIRVATGEADKAAIAAFFQSYFEPT
jgi:death-on-curing protein